MSGQLNIADSVDESARLNEGRSCQEAARIHDDVIELCDKFS